MGHTSKGDLVKDQKWKMGFNQSLIAELRFKSTHRQITKNKTEVQISQLRKIQGELFYAAVN